MRRGVQILILFCLSCYQTLTYAAYPPPISGHRGMVVSGHYLASKVGIDILKQGGNAIDAAVAVGYALAVVYPYAGNIGGDGFMLIHLAQGNNIFINFRGTAPLKATKNMFLDDKGKVIPNRSFIGYQAVAVPGTVLGLNTALQKYGTLPLATIMAPAIKLAEQGFKLTKVDADILHLATDDFKKQPNVASIFLYKGSPYRPGQVLVQSQLAATLKLIAAQGSKAFYQGSIADKIVKSSQQHGGILTKQDFINYKIEELSPVICHYKSYNIISAPPPSSGGTTLCELLNIIEPYHLEQMGFHSANSIHYLVEAMRYAYYDRNNKLGDPNFINNPVKQLISKRHAAKIRKKIDDLFITPSYKLAGVMEHQSANTTHYSIIDRSGNAVAVTYSLNNSFGARVIAGNTGFFLNDEMDDFTIKLGHPNIFGLVQGDNNKIEPGKRPLSSMTPTMVMTKNNEPFLILGSPGGATIITAILQTIINVMDYSMDLKTAVDMPRIHFQWLPDMIWCEPYSISADTHKRLKHMGYRMHYAENPLGVVEAIMVDPTGPIYLGASDDRIPLGRAIGY